jgi:hypothetical protein
MRQRMTQKNDPKELRRRKQNLEKAKENTILRFTKLVLIQQFILLRFTKLVSNHQKIILSFTKLVFTKRIPQLKEL